MLYVDYTQKLLNLQEVLVKKVLQDQFFTIIDIEMPVCVHSCPSCGSRVFAIDEFKGNTGDAKYQCIICLFETLLKFLHHNY